jgi:hypothetical protein
MRAIVTAPDFLDNNYLSAEHRVPVTLLQTNACSPLATNAIRDNIWDNFSSETYKALPSVGKITVYSPVTGDAQEYTMPAGGRGYTRPASLISLWSTAPFLLNNSVGKFNPSPSVEARMDSFQNSIEQMLWPEKREKDSVLGDKVPGLIDRATVSCYLRVPNGYLPAHLRRLGDWFFPSLFNEDGLELGPIPRGTPIGLLANLLVRPEEVTFRERLGHDWKLLKLLFEIRSKFKELGPNPTDERAQEVLKPLADRLMELSKCKDYIVNRGHYFGNGHDGEARLSDEDKFALIEFLKTF